MATQSPRYRCIRESLLTFLAMQITSAGRWQKVSHQSMTGSTTEKYHIHGYGCSGHISASKHLSP